MYCIVPGALAERLHVLLRRHFAETDPIVQVVVERRSKDRRAPGDRRRMIGEIADERRLIRNATGRRIADQRAPQIEVGVPALPRRALPYREQLRFVERAVPSDQHLEDVDTARLVMRFQAGERDVFAELYLRYFDRVYSYLRLALRGGSAAEDACQEVFTNLLDALPRYERRGPPFRGYLFTIVRNTAVDRLRDASRVEPVADDKLATLQSGSALSEARLADTLAWVSDADLMLFVERLPMVQQQVLFMRFMLDLSYREIAALLDRREDDVRAVQYRALQFLRERLTAVGRDSVRSRRAPMQRYLGKANVLRARRFALH